MNPRWGRSRAVGVSTVASSTVASEPCRLTICGPTRSVEVAVPAYVPLADVLPTLISYVGDNLPDAGLEHGGWVLQRLGGPVLDEDLSLAALGLRDGEVVHLLPRSAQLPPADFDDLVDGVATGIAARPDRWRPAMTRWLMLGLVLVGVAAAGVPLFLAGPTLGTTIAGGIAAALLAAATAVVARALGDAAGAGVLGAGAIGFASFAAASVPALVGGHNPGHLAMAGGAGAAGFALLVVTATGSWHAAGTGVATASAIVAIAGTIHGFTTLTAIEVAAVVLALVVPLAALVPVSAFRMARMQLAPLPTTPEELQQNLDPEPGAAVIARTAAADRYMTALYWALGSATAGCLALLAAQPTWPARLLTATAVLLVALHARVMVSAWQRLAAVVPACCGGLVLTVSVTGNLGPAGRFVMFGTLLAAAGLLYAGSALLPGRRLVPHFGRAADLLQSLSAAALLPLVLWVLDLYRVALGWWGG